MSDYGAVDKELVPGALRGYRTWRPYGDRSGVPLTLRACNFEVTWTPGVNWAICERGRGMAYRAVFWEEYTRPPDHPAPGKGCSCGFYATHDPRHVDNRGTIFGSIKAYGNVVLGTKGFRAGKVEIEALTVGDTWRAFEDTQAILGMLGDTYQVPTFQSIGELMEAFPPISVEHLLGDWEAKQERKREEAKKLRQYWVDEGYVKFTAQVADLEKTLPPSWHNPPWGQ